MGERQRRTAIALGMFDGVHLGHRAVIKAACHQRKNGLSAEVFTFSPESVKNKGAAGYIYTRQEKEKILCGELGIENIYSPSFEELRGLSGAEFAEDILCGRMGAAVVCCGADFRFGRNASCGGDELKALGKRFGFETVIVESVMDSGENISSSRIRKLLSEGDMTRANQLLGAEYFISAEVVSGNRIGRTISFPTINQYFGDGQLIPEFGVYSTSVNIDGKRLSAITNIGIRPTVGGTERPLAETHIIDYSGDLYGRNVDVSFRRFIRPERRFGSVEELKKQIKRDIEEAFS